MIRKYFYLHVNVDVRKCSQVFSVSLVAIRVYDVRNLLFIKKSRSIKLIDAIGYTKAFESVILIFVYVPFFLLCVLFSYCIPA